MHNRTLFAALAAAALAAIATPSVSHAQQPKESTGEVAMAPSFSSLMKAIDSASAINTQLSAATVTAENVQLVNVEDLLSTGSADSVTAAITRNSAAIDSLRSTIAANSAINGALAANSTPLTSNDVVATDVTSDGKVIVYYWKKP